MLSDFLNKNLLEAEDGLPFLIGKDRNKILVEGLLTPKAERSLEEIGRAINEKQ